MSQRIMARVDPRLVHGQITTAWAPSFGIDFIMVADDRAAGDPLEKSLLIAAGNGIEVVVKSLSELQVMSDAGQKPWGAGSTVMLLFRDLETASRAVRMGLPITKLAVANYSFKPGSRRVADSVFLSKHDEKLILELEANGVDVYCQTLPGDKPIRPWASEER